LLIIFEYIFDIFLPESIEGNIWEKPTETWGLAFLSSINPDMDGCGIAMTSPAVGT